MIKLIASDLDGTIVDTNNNVTVDNLKAIRKTIFYSGGNKISIGTTAKFEISEYLIFRFEGEFTPICTFPFNRNVPIFNYNGVKLQVDFDNMEIQVLSNDGGMLSLTSLNNVISSEF